MKEIFANDILIELFAKKRNFILTNNKLFDNISFVALEKEANEKDMKKNIEKNKKSCWLI